MDPTPSPYTSLGLLAATAPDQARRRILTAVRRFRGHLGDAATALSVSRATLRRLVQRLGLGADVEMVLETVEHEPPERHCKACGKQGHNARTCPAVKR